jgi:hypothetical protein
VDLMMKNIVTTTALAPSFGMPVAGSARPAAVCGGIGAHVRDRHLAVAQWATVDAVDAAVVTGIRPGNTAWSPPTC